MTQYLRPTTILADGSWTGAAADVADATGVNDATFMASPAAPTSAQVVKVALSSLGYVPASLTLRVRFQKSAAGGDTIKGTVEVRNGSDKTLVATRVISQNMTEAVEEYASTLTAQEQQAVISADALELWWYAEVGTFTATVTLSGGGTVADVSGAQASFQIQLDRTADAPVDVDYATVNGTATAGVDYQATSGTASIGIGTSATTVQVPIIARAGDQGSRSFSLGISNARTGGSGLTILTSSKTATIIEGKTLLQPSDFTYLGAVTVPYVPSKFTAYSTDPPYTHGMTHRYLNGQLRFYFNAHVYQNYPELIECDGSNLVSLLRTTSPYSSLTGYGSLGYADNGKTNINAGQCETIFWDDVDQRLYWTHVRDYAGMQDPPTTGYTLLNSPSSGMSSIVSAHGPVIMASSVYDYGTRYIKGVCTIPGWFLSQYAGLSGLRLGLGFGGVLSTLASGPTNVGPALVAMRPLDSQTDPENGYYTGSRVRMIHHPWHATGSTDTVPNPTSPYFARRDTKYWTWAQGGYLSTNSYLNPPNGWNGPGQGWWINNDHHKGQAIWIDTPTKTGFIVFPRFIEGCGYTTVLADPAPTLRTFAVANPGDLRVNDRFIVNNGYRRPGGNATYNGGYGEDRRIATITGNLITIAGDDLHIAPPAGALFFTGEWYQDGGVPWTRARPSWVCYDPMELGRAALGTITPDVTAWAWMHATGYPTVCNGTSYVWGGEHYGAVSGVSWDAVASRLYVQLGQYVMVYQVN